MSSSPIILDYEEKYVVPCQLRLSQGGVLYHFKFCQCVKRVRTLLCNGTDRLSAGEKCDHWDK